jgi:hypothetical protein
VSRGYTWAYYLSDDGNTYAWRTDSDYFVDTDRGWTGPAATGTIVYPRGWSPRRVVGHDSVGHRQVAIIADIAAPLWTGATTVFTIIGTDAVPHVCSVDFRQSEKMSLRPH